MKKSMRIAVVVASLALMLWVPAPAQTSDTTSRSVLSAASIDTTATPEKIAKTPGVLLYAELFGNGGWISLNCEVRLSQKLYLRGGAGFDGFVGISFPLMFNYLLGSDHDYFEVGAGLTFTSISADTYWPDSGIGTNNNPTMTRGIGTWDLGFSLE